MALKRILLFIAFFLAFFSQAVFAENLAPFKKGQLEVFGQNVQFKWDKETQKLSFIHYHEIRQLENRGSCLEVKLFSKDKQVLFEQKSSCFGQNRLIFPLLTFEKVQKSDLRQIRFFSFPFFIHFTL